MVEWQSLKPLEIAKEAGENRTRVDKRKGRKRERKEQKSFDFDLQITTLCNLGKGIESCVRFHCF